MAAQASLEDPGRLALDLRRGANGRLSGLAFDQGRSAALQPGRSSVAGLIRTVRRASEKSGCPGATLDRQVDVAVRTGPRRATSEPNTIEVLDAAPA